MEVIRIDGYTEAEKVAIARHHLLPRQLDRGRRCVRTRSQITDEAAAIVADYTREAGVRSLERELGQALRKAATKLAPAGATAPVTVDASDVREWLGRPRFFFEAADDECSRGGNRSCRDRRRWRRAVRRGQRVEGPEGLTLTGQLGDVMKESAEIALSYVRSHAAELGIDPTSLPDKRFHIHVPAAPFPRTVLRPESR